MTLSKVYDQITIIDLMRVLVLKNSDIYYFKLV